MSAALAALIVQQRISTPREAPMRGHRLTISVWVAAAGLGGCREFDAPSDARTATGASSAVSQPTFKAPSNASAVAVSQTQIDIRWQDNSPNETGFEIQRSVSGPSGAFDYVVTTGGNAVTYRDQGLNAATPYCYWVRAVRVGANGTMFSELSNITCTATLPNVPSPASGAGAVASMTAGVRVSWTDNSPNEDGFRIYRSVDGAAWALAAAVSANVTSWITDQPVCYRVAAFNTGGEAAPSNVACTVPAPASGASAVASSTTSVIVSWADNSPNEDGFRIFRSTDGTVWSLVASVGANVTSWLTGQPVCYRVVAYNGRGEATPSNTACAIPAAVSDATAMESGSTSVTISWSDKSPNEDGFRIYRSSDGLGGWTLATTLPANATSWVTSQPMCYRVAAFNAGGEAPSSNVACTIPAAPTNASLDWLQDDQFRLTWTDNSAIEDGYLVIRIYDTWCPGGGPACNAGGSEPRFREGVLASLPANSTSYGPLPYTPVVTEFTECECIYVVATKNWPVASARVRLPLYRSFRR